MAALYSKQCSGIIRLKVAPFECTKLTAIKKQVAALARVHVPQHVQISVNENIFIHNTRFQLRARTPKEKGVSNTLELHYQVDYGKLTSLRRKKSTPTVVTYFIMNRPSTYWTRKQLLPTPVSPSAMILSSISYVLEFDSFTETSANSSSRFEIVDILNTLMDWVCRWMELIQNSCWKRATYVPLSDSVSRNQGARPFVYKLFLPFFTMSPWLPMSGSVCWVLLLVQPFLLCVSNESKKTKADLEHGAICFVTPLKWPVKPAAVSRTFFRLNTNSKNLT